MSSDTERNRKGSFRRGNVVSPQPASDQTTMQSVFGFLQDYVPQAVSGPKEEKRERILWATFETGDLNDPSMEHLNASPSEGGARLPLLLILGMANGFSVWMIMHGGDAKELYCTYGEGETTRIARLLRTPENYNGVSPDKFAKHRPIIATVKKGRHSSTGGTVAYSTLQLVSLSATTDNLVKKFVFKSRPIIDIRCNRRVVAIVFQKRIVVLDAGSFENKFVVRNNYPFVGYPCNPVALGARWMAFSEVKLSSKHQSVGGMSNATPPSVATTVLKNVKKGITALTETISGLTGKAQQSYNEPVQHTQQSADPTSANIISVLDTNRPHPQEFKVHDLSRESSGVIAHFVAHTGSSIHIAALAFNPSGTLLVSASTEGHSFHVFHILPHPWLSSETAVHHVYTLFRGATSGVVQDICFTSDSRWVGVSTLNGTTHVFPISPYGGEITVRTHIPRRVVNKMSRFHTTAGIEHTPQSAPQHPNPNTSGTTGQHSQAHSQSLQSSPTADSRDFPSSAGGGNGLSVASNNWNNPRGLPLPCPVVVTALQQIKQPYTSTSETSGSNITTPASSKGMENTEPFVTLAGPETICVRAAFSDCTDSQSKRWGINDSPNERAMYSLYVIGSNGDLVEHMLEPQKLTTAPDGEDAPIELTHLFKLCWKLLGTPPSVTPGSIALPLSKENALIDAYSNYEHFLDTAKDDKQSSSSPSKVSRTDGEWLSQVEILTHAPPSRRLWMGPQFSFKSYQSNITSPSSITTASIAVLKTPSPPNTVIYTGSLTSPTSMPESHSAGTQTGGASTRQKSIHKKEAGSNEKKKKGSKVRLESDELGTQGATLFPSSENPLVDLLSEPPELQNLTLNSIDTSPLAMPTRTRQEGVEPGNRDPGVLEVFGSWNKVAPRLESATFEVEVEKQLEEAMFEQEGQSITVVASDTRARTGFYPPHAGGH